MLTSLYPLRKPAATECLGTPMESFSSNVKSLLINDDLSSLIWEGGVRQRRSLIRPRRGIILSSGGDSYNLKLFNRYRLIIKPDSRIDGLYSAGRTGVGLCSESNFSGLSIADTIFSGRRAPCTSPRLGFRVPGPFDHMHSCPGRSRRGVTQSRGYYS